MTFSNFLIANFRNGLDESVEPWLIPENAFRELDNVYLRNGVISKRPGITSFGQPSGGANAIRGVFHFNRVATADQLLAFTATDLYQWSSGTSWAGTP